MTIEQQVLEKLRDLPPEKQKEGERLTNHILRGGPECSNVAP